MDLEKDKVFTVRELTVPSEGDTEPRTKDETNHYCKERQTAKCKAPASEGGDRVGLF